jgi:hypothetical protein
MYVPNILNLQWPVNMFNKLTGNVNKDGCIDGALFTGGSASVVANVCPLNTIKREHTVDFSHVTGKLGGSRRRVSLPPLLCPPHFRCHRPLSPTVHYCWREIQLEHIIVWRWLEFETLCKIAQCNTTFMEQNKQSTFNKTQL